MKRHTQNFLKKCFDIATIYEKTGITLEEYEKRRETFISNIPNDSVCILQSGDITYLTENIPNRFRQNSNFYYLTGLRKPQSSLVFEKNSSGKVDLSFFVADRTELDVKWTGQFIGVDKVAEYLNFENVFSNTQFESYVEELVKKRDNVFLGGNLNTPKIIQLITQKRPKDLNENIFSCNPFIHNMRYFKSEDEMVLLKKALDVTGSSFCKVMETLEPGMNEMEVEGIFEAEAKRLGSIRLSFVPVVASGNRTNIIHYIKNCETINDGDLLLLDSGAEWKMYSSDITRTIPANGKFSQPQRDLYESVLEAHKITVEIIKKDKKKRNRLDFQKIAEKVLASQLVEREICQNCTVEKVLKNIDKFYPHSITHLLGLDIHDPDIFTDDFKKGSVFTLEPGLYMDPNEDYSEFSVDEKYLGMGIRIEDELTVNENDEIEILSNHIPREIDEIESIMK